jgi:hypothetical protein
MYPYTYISPSPALFLGYKQFMKIQRGVWKPRPQDIDAKSVGSDSETSVSSKSFEDSEDLDSEDLDSEDLDSEDSYFMFDVNDVVDVDDVDDE